MKALSGPARGTMVDGVLTGEFGREEAIFEKTFLYGVYVILTAMLVIKPAEIQHVKERYVHGRPEHSLAFIATAHG